MPTHATIRRSLTLALAGSLSGAISACRDAYDYETEHLRITLAGAEPVALCEGDLRGYEERIARLERMFSRAFGPPVEVELHTWYSAGREGEYNPRKRRIIASRGTLGHELVHAAAPGLSEKNKFFKEGVAEAFSGAPVLFPTALSLPSENISLGGTPDYATAGHFFRWIVATHGMERAEKLLRGEPFESVVGSPLVEVEQDWLAQAPWAYPPFDECPYPALSEYQDGWRETLSMECHDEAVTTDAVSGFEGTREACRVFEIARAGFYVVETLGQGWIKRCFREVVQDPLVFDPDRLPNAVEGPQNLHLLATTVDSSFFEVGRYAVCLHQLVSDSTPSTLVEITATATTAVRP